MKFDWWKFKLFSHENYLDEFGAKSNSNSFSVKSKSSYPVISSFKILFLSQILSNLSNLNYKIKSHPFIFSTKFTMKKRKKVSLPNLYYLCPLDFSLLHVLSCWPSSRGPHILYFPSSYLSSFHHTYKIREQVQTLLQHLPPRLLPLLLRLLKCQPSLSPTAPSTTSLVNVVTPSRSLRHHWVAPPLPSTHARDKTKLCPLDLPRLQLQLLYSTSNAWHLLRPTAPQVTLLSSPVLRGLQPHNTKFKFSTSSEFIKYKFSTSSPSTSSVSE